ncbi:hypothetical protein PVAND_000789 [Polypedilum vanderplanki]|uniref:Nudix hydrolase domain-containing protein n=1 Tax=Polypedilum vanderplanki TaxID=319348 RepID=A0A9J6BM40_POLVA|nr:hypothetical protein PVAND_000789 [Polypedilum vanderplanki]
MTTQKNYESSKLMSASEKWFNKYEHVKVVPDGVFQGVLDRFNGITIDSAAEECEESFFDEKLTKSIEHWIEEKKRAIWFKVHRDQSYMVPILVRNDFLYHHARGEFVMMYRWLPKDEVMAVPPFAHTMVGVGALVINDKNQVLVVSERNALIPNSWKLPGGYCEMRENLIDAAIREVEEETNIKTRFESLVSARHAHSAAFGCSDLYFILKLIPETQEITKCEREIADCRWMDIDEYLNHENVHETNRSFVSYWLSLQKNGMLIDVVDKTHKLLKRDYQIFFPRNIENGES